MPEQIESKGGVFEFRGVDNLVYAQVLKDNNEVDGGYQTGEVKLLAHVAEIGKTVETSSETKNYDNKPMIIISSEGADEIQMTVAPLALDVLADITGKTFDAALGMMVDGDREIKDFAVGYRTKGTDGKYRYVWRYKGQFNIPDETNITETPGTDSNNQQITFTGVKTIHEFTKGGAAKGIVVDTRFGNADLSTFFTQVTTPDTLTAKAQGVSVK